jgi:hypothetical protein
MSIIKDDGLFFAIIENAIRQHTADAVDKAAEAAAETVHKAVKAQLAKIVLEVLAQYTVERRGPELIIKVKVE